MPSVANGQLANPVKRQDGIGHQIRLAATSKTNWVSGTHTKKKMALTHYRLFFWGFFLCPQLFFWLVQIC